VRVILTSQAVFEVVLHPTTIFKCL